MNLQKFGKQFEKVHKRKPTADEILDAQKLSKSFSEKAPVAAAKTVAPVLTAAHVMQVDLEKVKTKREGTQKKYNQALDRIKQLEVEQAILLGLKESNPQVLEIEPKEHHGNGDAVAVIVLSDWHIEEPVTKDESGGVNEFSVEIAKGPR